MISVIIPTLNEKKNIQIIAKKLNNLKIVYEVIFVDDNSKDGTFFEIKKLLKKKKFRGYQRKKSRDLSKSVIFGAKKAKKSNILVMDCDLQHDTNYIKKMWKKFKATNSDIVIASRFKKKSLYGNLGILRSSMSKFAIFIINILIGKKTSDPLSGFFLCKKELITKYYTNFFGKGYKILFDILHNGKKNIKVLDHEIIFNLRKYEKSKFNLRIIKLFFSQIIYTLFLVKK
tara:strand:+ start:1873 stop:2562 length:690 start_codon:yes stop_codon:yes gene_type:complete